MVGARSPTRSVYVAGYRKPSSDAPLGRIDLVQQPRVVGDQLRRRVHRQLVERLRVDARVPLTVAAWRSSARSAGPPGTSRRWSGSRSGSRPALDDLAGRQVERAGRTVRPQLRRQVADPGLEQEGPLAPDQPRRVAAAARATPRCHRARRRTRPGRVRAGGIGRAPARCPRARGPRRADPQRTRVVLRDRARRPPCAPGARRWPARRSTTTASTAGRRGSAAAPPGPPPAGAVPLVAPLVARTRAR